MASFKPCQIFERTAEQLKELTEKQLSFKSKPAFKTVHVIQALSAAAAAAAAASDRKPAHGSARHLSGKLPKPNATTRRPHYTIVARPGGFVGFFVVSCRKPLSLGRLERV
ncbi:hypothetical protein ACI3LZ_004075 [Candidozyma auris]